MQEFTSSEAYVQFPQPMPVGSSIVLCVGEELQIPVRVARVSEQVAGAPRSPGMFVQAAELDAVAKAWWDGNVSEPAAVSEPATGSEPAAASEPATGSEPAQASEPAKEDSEGPDTEVMDVVTPEEVAAAKAAKASAAPAEEAAAEAPAKGKKKRRRRRQTRNK